MEDWIYLDYNASTPMAGEVLDAMTASLKAQAHPSSKHPHGLEAAQAVSHARRQVADALNAAPEEIVFCSGSTEAANHVIKGVAFSRLEAGPLHFISSAVEHPATSKPLEFLKKFGHQVTEIPVDEFGRIRPQAIADAIQDNTALVTLIHAQNEIGTLQPIAEVGQLCRERKVLFHVDASQSFGKVPVDVAAAKADYLNIAGHKIYGPKGVGALYIRAGVTLEPLLHGGGHESGFRSGTPAPQLIVGLGSACELATRRGPVPSEACQLLWRELSQALGDRVRRNGHPEHRLPNVLHCTFKGAFGGELLESAKLCASTGAACHSAAGSPVLRALGFSPEEARGSVRLSLGWDTSTETARQAAARLVKAYNTSQAGVGAG